MTPVDIAQGFGWEVFVMVLILSGAGAGLTWAAKWVTRVMEKSDEREQRRYAESQAMNERMICVVQANTEASNRIAVAMAKTSDTLDSHDARSAAALMDIPVIASGVQRIEQKLDAHIVSSNKKAT